MTGAFSGTSGVDAAACDTVAGAHALVLGLGRFGGGVGVTRWLVDQGARVTVTDCAPAESLAKSLDQLADCAVSFKLGRNDPADLDGMDFVVVNPAVDKRRSAFFGEVVRRGIPWTTEINLFCRRCRGTVVGVTGSFGKSTTCAMITAALGRWVDTSSTPYSRVFLGGNIGQSLLGHLAEIAADGIVVLELSSAQLDDLPRIGWSPPLAVITNIRPHHMDRYAGFEAYIDAKLNIVRDPKHASRVLYADLPDPAIERLRDELRDRPERCQRVVNPDPPIDLCIPGRHNQRNASVAFAVCCRLGVRDAIVREALASFTGLPHRLELIRTIDGVDYINDSKCTSLRAMTASVEAVASPCVLIAGGRANSQSLDDRTCAMLLRNCRIIVLTGETAFEWLAALRDSLRSVQEDTSEPDLPTIAEAEDLEAAVRLARESATAGHVVLFAPGAPSFDRYANFAERGDHFRAIVGALAAG